MKPTPTRLYNVIFPVWFLFLIPSTFIFILPMNFIIDSLVLYISMKALHMEEPKMLYKNSILKVWGFGFLADFIGAFFLLLMLLLGDQIPGMSNIINDMCTNPFQNWIGLLIVLVAIAISGWFIYLFNLRFSFKGLGVSKEDTRQLALWLSLVTAPYTFLIPTTLLYSFAH